MKFDDFILSGKSSSAKPIPWKDLQFSQRSLQLHLDQAHDVNSRRDSIIQQQTSWIHGSILNEKPSKILDLACGPGLYTKKLSNLGHHCLGVDISPAVIEFAKSKNHKNCTYLCEDMLQFSTEEKFDLVLLNFGWFQNFTPSEAEKLMVNIAQMLNPGGILLLEMLYYGAVQEFGENTPQWHRAKSGVFSQHPYIFFQENSWNMEKAEACVYYHIFESSDKLTSYIQTYQGYQKDDICELLAKYHFDDFEFYHDLFCEDDFSEDLFFLSAKFDGKSNL